MREAKGVFEIIAPSNSYLQRRSQDGWGAEAPPLAIKFDQKKTE